MKLFGVMINSEDTKVLGEFYDKIAGKRMMDEGGFIGYDFGGNWLMVGPHSEVHGKSKEPPRVMISIESPDIKADFEKMKAAGATVVAEPYQPSVTDNPTVWLATVADPDGNYLQLSTPWEE